MFNSRVCRFLLVALALAGASQRLLLAQLPAQQGLPIPEVGKMVDIPGAHETPDPRIDYKIVFELNTAAEKPDEVNPGLETVAALVNTFAHYKVGAEHRHFVAIFHGPTVELVMNDAAYRASHQGHANPNVRLMQELAAAGVQLVVCGQSALQHHIDLKTIQPDVQLNLSATVTLMNLAMQGYTRIDE
ncbi:DsrE family protein [Acidipila sp. EB88]|uniref:DsrE family protein n=1 Tax=Acidipila sp. EB88 TaxID=2305226 RepID=UPI0013154B2E|nr:DsrE family protein [Acidipila sp. EB88]